MLSLVVFNVVTQFDTFATNTTEVYLRKFYILSANYTKTIPGNIL